MNRKLIVSLGIIALLVAVIVIKKHRSGNGVTDPGKLTAQADMISVKGEGYALSLVKPDGKWLINEQKYQANPELVADIEKKISEIKLLDLVSEKGYFDKYDLAEGKGTEVILSAGGKQLRKVMIGKQGLTNNQAYVRIDDSKGVYLASDITAAEFKPEIDAIRDKDIFEVKTDAVQSFSIKYMGKEYSFVKSEVKQEESAAGEKGKTPSPKGALWKCKGYESMELNPSLISNILFSFSPLRASTFAENDVPGSAICTVKVKTAERSYELNIYGKKDKEMYLARSPECPYTFTLGGWQTEKYFVKNIKDFEKKK